MTKLLDKKIDNLQNAFNGKYENSKFRKLRTFNPVECTQLT